MLVYYNFDQRGCYITMHYFDKYTPERNWWFFLSLSLLLPSFSPSIALSLSLFPLSFTPPTPPPCHTQALCIDAKNKEMSYELLVTIAPSISNKQLVHCRLIWWRNPLYWASISLLSEWELHNRTMPVLNNTTLGRNNWRSLKQQQ